MKNLTNWPWTMRSRTLDRSGRIEMGLKSLGCEGETILGKGTIYAFFHSRGKVAVASEVLNMSVMTGVTMSIIGLSASILRPSLPTDFDLIA